MKLELRNISKDFGGVKALDQVSVEFLPGCVNALVGENGAGKSTLMKILSGVHSSFEGQIFLDGKEQQFTNPREAEAAGIAIIHQELNLVPDLSIADNIFLGREPLNAWGLLDEKLMHLKTIELLSSLDLSLDPDLPVSQLKIGQQQLVEIAKALLAEAQVLVMDEPTSAISDAEIHKLFAIVRRLKAEGKTIVYISHKMKELFELCDRFVVLRDGRHIASIDAAATDAKDLVVKMTGRPIEQRLIKESKSFGPVLLEVEGLSLFDSSSKKLLDSISFCLRKGEVLGIYGLLGAGRTELLETLFGLHKNIQFQKIEIGGQTYLPASPSDAMKAGLALVPEDRKIQGLLLDWSLSDNMSLPSLENFEQPWGGLDRSAEERLAASFVKELFIKTDGINQSVSSLSGGNQQKIVLAKWLATNPKVLLLDEPTRGVDVNAKMEIYRLIQELSIKGLSIIVVSSELPEILAVSDTVMVMREGTISAIMLVTEANETNLLTLALPQ